MCRCQPPPPPPPPPAELHFQSWRSVQRGIFTFAPPPPPPRQTAWRRPWPWSMDYLYPRKKVNIYVKSFPSYSLAFWQSSVQRGRHTKLCIISSLTWIIQISSKYPYYSLISSSFFRSVHNLVNQSNPNNMVMQRRPFHTTILDARLLKGRHLVLVRQDLA